MFSKIIFSLALIMMTSVVSAQENQHNSQHSHSHTNTHINSSKQDQAQSQDQTKRSHQHHQKPHQSAHSSHKKKPMTPLPLTVNSGRVIAVPKGIQETTVIAHLKNKSNKDIKLNSVHCELAGHGMLMITTKSKKGLMGMKTVPFLTVPANGVLELKTDGDHLMLSKLKRQLRVGEVLKITIGATDGRTVSFKALVKKP